MKKRSLWNAVWSSVGGLFGLGGYSATDPRRKILPSGTRPTNASANQLLSASLPQLRAHCRHLERNNPVARGSVEGLLALIVGTGIGLEPDTGDENTDERIRAVWQDFIADCAANGFHDIYYLQGQALREMVTAGEFLWRLVPIPEMADEGKIPLAILPLEAEWLHDQSNSQGQPDENGIVWISGVGINNLGRPVAYKIRNPEQLGGEPQTLTSKEIVHGFEHRRALQARGEPWMSPIIEVLQQERDLVDSELKSAVVNSSVSMTITSDIHDGLDTEEQGTSTDPAQTLRVGGVARLYPGEKIDAHDHTRPGQQIANFRKTLRGDQAAAMRIPQRFLDRDVSQANYSSMRADMLDSDRLLAPVREWFGHATIGRVYREVLPYLALKAGIKTPRAKYRLLPDGQPYVDPYKDIQAAAMSIVTGVSTHEAEIAKRGGDYKKVWQQIAKERKEAAALGISFDMSGTNAPAPESQVGKEEETETKKKPAAGNDDD